MTARPPPLAALLVLLAACAAPPEPSASTALPDPWPPVTGQAYPSLGLVDYTGQPVDLGKRRGRVLLIEPIAMSCELCQSYSGAGQAGAFGDVAVTTKIRGWEEYLQEAGVDPAHPDLDYVQVVLFGLGEGAPSVAEAAVWAEHFRLDERANTTVLVGDARYATKAGHELYPGFHLVDRDGVLRAWTSGHRTGGVSLKRELLPMLSGMLEPGAAKKESGNSLQSVVPGLGP